MLYGTDARVMCGMDVRSQVPSPTDDARADGFVAQYGGQLAIYPVGGVAIGLDWTPPDGEPTVHIAAPSVGEALSRLRERVQC